MKADVFNFGAFVRAYVMFVDYVVDRFASEPGTPFKSVMTSTKESISMYRTLMYYRGNLLQFFEPYKIVAVGKVLCENGCCEGVAIIDQNELTLLVRIDDEEETTHVERTLH